MATLLLNAEEVLAVKNLAAPAEAFASLASATICAEAILKAMPKTKAADLAGEFNELLLALRGALSLVTVMDQKIEILAGPSS